MVGVGAPPLAFDRILDPVFEQRLESSLELGQMSTMAAPSTSVGAFARVLPSQAPELASDCGKLQGRVHMFTSMGSSAAWRGVSRQFGGNS
jgi:hypothetical protein